MLMKIVIFGTGDYYQKNISRFESESVVALLDNNPEKEDTYLNGKKVYSPLRVAEIDYDYIVIMSLYANSMRNQLLELGVPDKKIILFSELQDHPELQLKDQCAVVSGSSYSFNNYIDSINKKDYILMMSGNMDLNGASIAFVNMALILKKNGFDVLMVSAGDGKLADVLRGNGITVIIDPNILYKTCVELQWTSEFETIICNTLLFYKFLSDVKPEIQVLWWLHDPDILYTSLNKEVLAKVRSDGISVYAVGPIAEKAIKSCHPEYEVKTLLYGISAMHIDRKKKTKKLEMAVIANVQEYKGQDIIVDAIRDLNENELNALHIRIIGNQNSYYACDLKKKVCAIDVVEFVPEMDRNGIESVYSELDVLLCPSRVDCMPVSVAEAMQNCIPAIVSDTVGTAEYITDYENGLIFKSGSSEELADRIRWCINNKEKLSEIGRKAREVYDNYFSLDMFEKNMLDAIRDSFSKRDRIVGS